MSKLSRSLGVLLGGSLGATASWAFSAPKSPIERKIPHTEVRNFEISPNVEIKRKKQIYHIHHWMIFSVFYASLLILKKPITGRRFVNGFVLGLIIQGLTYKDRLKVKEPHISLSTG